MALPTTKDELETLAFEVAFRYFTPDQLCNRFDITPEQLDALRTEPRFQTMVLRAEREIDEAGSHMKVAARKLVGALVPSIASIARDPTEEVSDRLAAFKQLVAIAGVTSDPRESAGSGFQINLNITPPAAPEQTAPGRIIENGD